MNDNFIQSIFAPQEINKVSDYERFRNTRSFIREKSLSISNNRWKDADSCELMKKCGYRNYHKLFDHRIDWNDLRRWVPLVYLGAIGADLETIDYVVRLDQDEYDQALRIPLFPKYAVVRIMPAIYSQQNLPPGTPEDEAIQIIKKYSLKNKLRCCIKIPDIKTIWIEPDGKDFVTYYRPSFRITKSWAIFSQDGRDVAVSKIV